MWIFKETKTIPLNDIYYLNNHKSSIQTLIAEIDLKNIGELKVHSYLIDMNDAYVSENNIYLANQSYGYDEVQVKDLFGIKGILGLFEKIDTSYDRETEIYKFKMNEDRGVSYVAHKKVKGKIINQYSMDEDNDVNFRILTTTWHNQNATHLVILDKNLKIK